ncbi:MAG: beta-ketoacyl synthase N-terminal-like domain-containing protein [Gemmataceae bacterium]
MSKPVAALKHTADSETDVPLAIVGMGCLFPKANSLAEYWSNIKNAVDCIGPIPKTHWSPDELFDADPKRPDFTYARRGGFLDPYPFQPGEFGISPRDLEAIDTAQLLGLVVAKMALDDAGMLQPEVDRSRVSVILGVTGTLELVVPLGARLGHPLWRKALRDSGVPDEVADQVVERIANSYVGWQENSFPGLLGNVVAGRIANRLDLGGTNCVVDAACASSLSALHLAALELAAGRADAVLTGGVDTFNDIFMYMCFSKTPALSPSGDAKPFSEEADGTILGEGIGMLVLKRLADAEAAGDRIYAVIKGLGSSSDGKGNAVYAPSAEGQKEALKRAYARAAVSPAAIGLVEAHGTGTKVGDAVEISALDDVYCAAKARSAAVGSVKSQIGHTKAAAGAAGIIKAAMALHKKVLPPTIKVVTPASTFIKQDSALYINSETRPWVGDDEPRRAAVSSFGFGGSNFHCVLEEHPTDGTPDWSGEVEILAVSGAERALVESQLENVLATAADWTSLAWAAGESRKQFKSSDAERVTAVVIRNGQKWIVSGRFNGSGDVGRLGMLFPGQGSQYVGMLGDLACQFPEFQDVLTQANRAFAANLVNPPSRLSDFIYPRPAFSGEAKQKQDLDLRDTTVAQPALGAVSLAALQVLRRFGVTPNATAGHSYGELTALCAAGCYDAPSLFALSQLRGRLMAERSVDDAGAMLAVMAPMDTIESVVAEGEFDVVVANRNAPRQSVLSGSTVQIEKAERAFTKRQVRFVRLPVAAAFHSALVGGATKPFREALEPISLQTAQLPVFANTTASEYPRDPQAARDLLAEQLSKPVDFVQQIRNMYDSGVRAFVEVGPGQILTRLVDSILTDSPHDAIALDASAGRKSGELDLAITVARLAALGHSVKLEAWHPDVRPPAAKPKGLVVPICGANYVHPKQSAAAPATNRIAASPPKPPKAPMAEPPKPQQPIPAPAPSPRKAEPVRASHDSLTAFLKLQEQTADVHRLFLEQQLQAQRTLQALLGGHVIAAPVATPLPIEAAAEVAAPPPPEPRIPKAAAVTPPKAPPIVAPSSNGTATIATRASSSLTDTLLAVVAEKTGYPVAMLDLDMGLDADLGIDSIKRVEILSALQERLPKTPSVPPDRLGSLQTLRQVVELLDQTAGVSDAVEAPLANSHADELTDTLLAVVAEKTGYPTAMLDLDMGLDADLGIDSIKRVEILSALQERLPDTPAVPPERLGSLQTLRQVVDLLQPEKKKSSHGLLI